MALDLTALGRQLRAMGGALVAGADDRLERRMLVLQRLLRESAQPAWWARGVDLSANTAEWLLAHAPRPIHFEQAEVTRIAGRTVHLADGSQRSAGAVLLAAGIEAPRLCPGLPIRPKKGHLAITERHPGLLRHQLVELGYITSAHHSDGTSVAFNLQPRPTGQLLIGSSRQFDTTDPAVERWSRCTRAPVSRASAMSRMTISSSASAGCPGSPRRALHSPSCMQVPRESSLTSQCWARVTPRSRPYSMARRMSRSSWTPRPSSVKSRTPSAAISAMGARRSPARSTVMAPEVWTSQRAVRPSSRTSCTTAAQSIAGVVFGMARTAV